MYVEPRTSFGLDVPGGFAEPMQHWYRLPRGLLYLLAITTLGHDHGNTLQMHDYVTAASGQYVAPSGSHVAHNQPMDAKGARHLLLRKYLEGWGT